MIMKLLRGINTFVMYTIAMLFATVGMFICKTGKGFLDLGRYTDDAVHIRDPKKG